MDFGRTVMENLNEGYVFGLDIGTRSIVGTVGYRVGTDRFVVVAQEAVEHTTRAVIDGQIHDIDTVARTIVEVKTALEKKLSQSLNEVSIAAAGRVLKTKEVRVKMEFPDETKVSKDHIKSMEMSGVEQAYEEIRGDADNANRKFFCVGYSPARYYLNGYQMDMLEHHKANFIEMDLIATFLPDEVVEGLYDAVEKAGLHVASLTLEPIAAINVAIPEKFRLLNLALVDVGAGTSDLSIVKDGSIIAYGMIPLAGDEISEAIAKEYLTDFETAENVKRKTSLGKTVSFKNIFGDSLKATQADVQNVVKETVEEITRKIADRIVRLNGGKSVSAVFIVGGGGRQEGFTQSLAKHLRIAEDRVAIRGADVLANIDFPDDKFQKDSLMVTPIGICLSAYDQSNNFIHVTVNDQPVKLYDNGKVTVLDACLTCGFSQDKLFPTKGDSLYYYVNGERREVKGDSGEVVSVRKNRHEVSLNDPVKQEDVIILRPSTKGAKGAITLGQIAECRQELTIKLFGKTMIVPKKVEVNGVAEISAYNVKDDDDVVVYEYITVGDLLEFAGYEKTDKVMLNGKAANLNARVNDGDEIDDYIVEKKKPAVKKTVPKPASAKPRPATQQTQTAVTPAQTVASDEPKQNKTLEEALAEDPLLKPLKPLPEWMEDVPFDTPKLGSDGSVIPGYEDRMKGTNPYEQPKQLDDVILDSIDDTPPAPKPRPAFPTHIKVNGQEVTIPPKQKRAIFVDIFDVYPFDMSKVGGKKLITRINGKDKNFTDPLRDGDEVEIFWQK